jgi:hypothetical protein
LYITQISREEGVDPFGLHAGKQPNGDQDKDDHNAEYDRKSQSFLRGARDKLEQETLFLRNNGVASGIGGTLRGRTSRRYATSCRRATFSRRSGSGVPEQ